jgi:hypothetical protein
MGIRSDVGIAVKSEFTEGFEAIASEHQVDFANTFTKEEGKAYLFEYVKWNTDFSHVEALTNYLTSIGEENYIIVEACHDYPESTDGDAGEWYDNPFNVSRNISVSISIDSE